MFNACRVNWLRRGGRLSSGLLAAAVVLLGAGAGEARGDGEEVRFSRDIRPILSDNCFLCHGPDEGGREADLRLDLRETAVAARADSGAAIVPSDPDGSELIRRVASDDPNHVMPPPETGRELSGEQIELLRRWVEQGAEWEEHWAFAPVERVEPPAVERTDWPRNGIDHFILAELEGRGIGPSPEADRYTQVRRLHLDLLGLPPTPEEADAFVDDDRPDAYERLVERVLSNPHHGERWGRHWLDQARYADSDGYAIDGPRSIWPYRDWVIRAINEDMPFDRFTVEQIAGDLLEGPSREQIVATGFHRNTLVNDEGGSDPEQFRVESVIDRVNTTGAVWLGLTTGCAQCHTHKYDPISQHEYFSLYAFFNHTEDRNSRSPMMPVPSEEQEDRLAELGANIEAAREALAARDAEIAERRPAWEERTRAELDEPLGWSRLDPAEYRSTGGATLSKLDDGSVLAGGENADRDTYEVTLRTEETGIRAIRLETLTHADLPHTGPGRAGNGNFVLTGFEVEAISVEDPDERRTVGFAEVRADHEQEDYRAGGAIDGRADTGWAPEGYRHREDRFAVFRAAEPFGFEGGTELRVRLRHESRHAGYNVGRFRVSVTDSAAPFRALDDEGAALAGALHTPVEERADDQSELIDEAFGESDAERRAIASELAELREERRELRREIPTTMVMRERADRRDTHVHIRGDFLRDGDAVDPDVPAVLPPLASVEGLPEEAEQRTRLHLAKWLVDDANPLTPRVTVNRIWMRYFGTGLVETENDFGMQGASPTHPELLDYLAAELVDSGWSIRHIHRLIVNSATYRQSSAARPDLAEIDPANRLLARQSRFRVEAEVVRDVALAAAGALHDQIGGPSVYPPQPEGVYAFTQRQQSWPTSTGPDRFRRGIYTFIYRSAPHPMLTTFDMPRLDSTCTARIRSNTPLQSLAVANDESMFEIAQRFALRVLEDGGEVDDGERLRRAFRLGLTREPTAGERERLLVYLEQQRGAFAADPSAAEAVAPEDMPGGVPAPEAAAWVAAARLIMNLDEFITRE